VAGSNKGAAKAASFRMTFEGELPVNRGLIFFGREPPTPVERLACFREKRG
jgi:hypothetical protein